MHKTKLLACLVAWLWVPGQALNLRLKSTGLLGRVAALNRKRAKGASSLSQSLQSGSGPSSKLSKSRKARAARAASIRKQLQMPDAYSLDTEQTMPLARNVMSCYCLAEEYDTEALVEAFKSRAIIIGDVAVVGSGYSPRDDGTLVDLEEFMDKPVAFFFPYGGAVLWGFTETEATSLLVDVETFATNMLTEDEAEVDRMIFGSAEAPPPAASGLIPGGPASGLGPLFSPNFGQETPTSISFARTGASFILRPDARDPLAKLSVSYAFAQSARLGALEAQVEALVEDVRPIPEALAATGKCEALGEKDVAQLTGRSFLISSAVNLYSDILQVPDFFWENEQYQPLYTRASAYLDLDDRTSILNSRLSVVDSLLDNLAVQLANDHSSKLEVIIIWLIVIEVVLEIGVETFLGPPKLIGSAAIKLLASLT